MEPQGPTTALLRARTLILAIAACVWVGCGTAHRGAQEPLSWVAPEQLASELSARAGEHCAADLRRQVASGQREAGDCDAVTSTAARRLVLAHGVRFGIVDYRSVALTTANFRVSQAMLCHGWPLPSAPGEVLRTADGNEAGCLMRPYTGDVAVVAVDRKGERHHVFALAADRDGMLRLEFSAVDAALRDSTTAGLDDYLWLELGQSAWVGTIDLDAFRGYLADWHFAWVSKGRGSAALFAKRHGAHPRGSQAQALAIQARVQRQERDFLAVVEGRMEPASFLRRHVWSPFRRAVEAYLRGDKTLAQLSG